jgi:hypothetical protein
VDLYDFLVERLSRVIAIGISLLIFASAERSYAAETVFDAITPQTNASISNYYGLASQKYGAGFIAGESREVTAFEILVSRSEVPGTVVGRLYQNSSNGVSGSGTLVGEFTQSAAASSYSGSVSNAFVLRLTGSAQVVSGLKYWVHFTSVSYTGFEANAFGSTAPTVSAGWQMITSSGNFIVTSAGNSFTFSSYPIFRVIVSTPTTIELTLSGGGNQVVYRKNTNIQASVNSNGPVTFFANGKKIPRCTKIVSSGGVATCPWKATTHALISLTARVTPTDSVNYAPKTSNPLMVHAGKRAGAR